MRRGMDFDLYKTTSKPMKIKMRYILAFFLILCSIPMLEAQYGNPYYRGRRRSVVPQAQETQKEPEPQTAEQIVANEMPRITEALELSDFEQAIVSSIMTKYVQQGIELRLLELSPDDTREGIQNIREKQDEELRESLPEEKYNALLDLREKGFKKKKDKKKKKKKKKKDKDKQS